MTKPVTAALEALVTAIRNETPIKIVEASLIGAIRTIEAADFRTLHDTGANPNAMIILNRLRGVAGLPSIGREDLPAWDESVQKYVRPANSKLLPQD